MVACRSAKAAQSTRRSGKGFPIGDLTLSRGKTIGRRLDQDSRPRWLDLSREVYCCKLSMKTDFVSRHFENHHLRLVIVFVLLLVGCKKSQPVAVDLTIELRKEIQSESSDRRLRAIETLHSSEVPDEFLELLAERFADNDRRVRKSTAAIIMKMVRKDPVFIQKLYKILPKLNIAIQLETDEITKSMMLDLMESIKSTSDFSSD